jgi:CheY-like chemotaxis protein
MQHPATDLLVNPLNPAAAARILVVEDHAVNRLVVKMMLEVFGYDLSFAENGLLAVEACARQDFDLVLMDLQMPVMDGLTAVRQIRAREAEVGHPRMPIAMVSANVGPDYEMQASLAGADGYIAKPLSLDKLMGGIAHALRAAGRFVPQAPQAQLA